MFSLKTLFVHRQPAVEQEDTIDLLPPPPSIIRENFTWDTDSMTVEQVIEKLRQQTVNFSLKNITTWAITDLDFRGVEIRCKLTEDQDIVWAVNGEQFFSPRAVVNMVRELAIQF